MIPISQVTQMVKENNLTVTLAIGDGANDVAPELTQRLPNLGTFCEQTSLLLRVLCGQIASELHSGCQNAEGCLGKSEKDFRHKHHNQEAPTLIGVELCAST